MNDLLKTISSPIDLLYTSIKRRREGGRPPINPMKKFLINIARFFLKPSLFIIIAQSVFAQDMPIPSLTGLPNISISRQDGGWTFKMPEGKVYLFAPDKEPQLKLLLNPVNSHIRPDVLASLNTLALNQGEAVPAEFLVVPYAHGKPPRLYQCIMSFHQDRIFCNIVALPTIPLPIRDRVPPVRVMPQY